MSMDRDKLNEILEKHKLWLEGDARGERADLSGANLEETDLRGVNLRNADLRNAYLKEADLGGADLRRANLGYATLEEADLGGVDLRNANLSYANLSYADITRANLAGVNSSGIKGQRVIGVQVNASRRNNSISYWVDLEIWTTGCFQGSLDELKKSIEETHKNNEFLRNRYYHMIDFILYEAEQDKARKKEFGMNLDDHIREEVRQVNL